MTGVFTSCSPNNNNWSQTVLGSLLQIMKTINVSYQASRLCQTISNSMSSVLSLTLYCRYYRDMQNVFFRWFQQWSSSFSESDEAGDVGFNRNTKRGFTILPSFPLVGSGERAEGWSECQLGQWESDLPSSLLSAYHISYKVLLVLAMMLVLAGGPHGLLRLMELLQTWNIDWVTW